MSRRLNWERAKPKKPTQSLPDERESMERDRAANWLEWRQASLTKAVQSSPVAPSTGTSRQQSNPLLPWDGDSEFGPSRHSGKRRR
jgi:hypothetical protein